MLEEEFIPIGRSRGHGLEPKTKNLDEVDLSSLSARTFLDLITNNNPLAIVGDLLVVGRGTVPSSLGVYSSVQDSSPIIFLVAWILVRLDIHVPSSTLVLFLGALTGVVQRVLYRGDFLNHCSGVPSHYGPFSFPIAVHFDELIIALGLMFPCLFIDRMFALIRLW